MKKNTLKREAVSRVDQVILEKKRITRNEIQGIYETVFYERCNDFMHICGGRTLAYMKWLHEEVGVFIRKVKDPITSEKDGSTKFMRRWGYDKSIDAYVFATTKVKEEHQVAPARRANYYKEQWAKTCVDKIADEKKYVDEQEVEIKKQVEHRQWEASNPALFPYPTGTDPQDQMR